MLHRYVKQKPLFPFRWDVPDSKIGRSEHLSSVNSITEVLPLSGLVLITRWSLVRFKQHFSNRCRSVKKAKGHSFPSQSSIAQQHRCNTLWHRNILDPALDRITNVHKSLYSNKALEMWLTALLPGAQAGRAVRGCASCPHMGTEFSTAEAEPKAQHAANTKHFHWAVHC